MAELIQKAATPESYRVQIINMVVDRMVHSQQHFTVIRKEMPQLYDLYRGILVGRFSPHKNNVHIPLIFSTIQSDVARKVQASFGERPVVNFVGYGPDDAPVARKREALIDAQMRDCGSFKKAYELFLTADLYGVGIAQWGWNHVEQEMLITRNERLPVSGIDVTISDKQTITTFDGPNWRVLDGLDCFPQPGYRNVDDMQWFITREYLDLDEIRAMAAFNDAGLAVFDPSEVRKMESEGIGAVPAVDDYKTWRTSGRTVLDSETRLREKYARPVEVLTMWGTVPTELTPDAGPDTGIANRVITVANRRYLLRNRPNPFWNGKKPILVYSPMPDPHFFYAAGKAEIAKKLQVVANRFTNQTLDALDIFIDPAFFYNQNTNLNTRNLLMRPGKFIPIDGEPNASIMPVVPNLSGIQLGTQMTENVWRWLQQGSGIVEDTVMGGAGGGRQTAREFLGRAEGVAVRLNMESRMFEEFFLEPMADAFVDLNRQFLDLPHEVLILGRNATVDPVTGQQIPQTQRDSIGGFDLVPNYDAHAVGASMALNRQQRRQDTAFLIQAMSSNPMTAAAVNWINFFRDVLRLFDYDNVDELINAQPVMEKYIQMAGGQQSQQIPGTPTQAKEFQGLANYLGQGVV